MCPARENREESLLRHFRRAWLWGPLEREHHGLQPRRFACGPRRTGRGRQRSPQSADRGRNRCQLTFAIDLAKEPSHTGRVLGPEKINLNCLHLFTPHMKRLCKFVAYQEQSGDKISGNGTFPILPDDHQQPLRPVGIQNDVVKIRRAVKLLHQ